MTVLEALKYEFGTIRAFLKKLKGPKPIFRPSETVKMSIFRPSGTVKMSIFEVQKLLNLTLLKK